MIGGKARRAKFSSRTGSLPVRYGSGVTVQAAVARGPGPMPVRIVAAVLAGVYFFLLVFQPAHRGWRSVFAYFAECTALFPQADWIGATEATKVPGAKELRVEAYSCDRARWELLDPRPYFPIQADDKESRLPRLVYFYIEKENVAEQARATAHALEDYLFAHHAAGDGDGDDGVPGPLGGIKLLRVAHAVGAPGDDVPRYHFQPRAPIAADDHVTMLYQTQVGDHDGHVGIKTRCKAAR